MNSGDLRVGVIGAGGISAAHLRGYRANGATIAAVADVDLARARARADEYGGAAYADYREMLEREHLDAVSICAPPNVHRDAALAAIARGLPVLCEKPLARTVEEGREMVAAAELAGTIFQTAFCHRFHGPIIGLKQLIDEGALGEPVAFRNRFGGHPRGIERSWFVQPEISGGGVLLDNGVHSVDLFRHLCGEVASATARTRTVLPGLRVEDTVALLLVATGGAIGTIELSYAAPVSDNVVIVYGTAGQGVVDYDAGELRYRREVDTAWTREPAAPPDRFQREIEHFLRCVRTGERPRVDGRDGLRALEVIAEAYRSAGAVG